MSTSSYDSVFGLGVTRIAVPIGSTVAVLVDLSSNAGANSVLFKYFSGGTLEILGVAAGTTLTAAQLGTANQTGYLVGTSEILSFDGPTRFYLSSTSATTVVHMIFGKSQST